jgi:beta-mannosidase
MSIFTELHQGWEFRQVLSEKWRHAQVPGCVHLDLLKNNLIDDPFYRDNEKKVQWVGESDWEYRLIFDVSPEMLAHPHLRLQFDGLDTYATVYLNQAKILEADNMFRRWQVDVQSHLRAGGNELLVCFQSPVNRVKPQLSEKEIILPALGDQAGGTSPYTRKARYHYGWERGPALIACGVWKAVRLIGWHNCYIADMRIDQLHVSQREADVAVHVEVMAAHEQHAEIIIEIPELGLANHSVITLQKGVNHFSETPLIRDPQLWQPAGYGSQPLYHIRAHLASAEENHLVEKRIGLRRIEARREKDAGGESFAFYINDKPVFMKGANWIPADSLTPRVSPERYRYLLQSARDAHFNMLRVWGGGIYEDDLFYDLCDELGILVWQDFMFACALYPADEAFLKSVRLEAADQVKRLRHHPCLALWCGNSEIELGWEDRGWKEKYPARLLQEDYYKLTYVMLAEVCRFQDPSRLYWPSSPASDVVFPNNPGDQRRGDVHCWDVWEKKRPFESYLQQSPRFVSEYGFQSFPEPRSVKEFTVPEDHDIFSPVMRWRERGQEGNDMIKNYMEQYYRVPQKFEDFLWLSQILQAEGVKIGAEYFRRLRPHCMGSLYWQINDCWPAASGSSVDYYGRWKALHYYARRFYAPVLISPLLQEGRCRIMVVSDRAERFVSEVRIEVMDFSGKKVLEQRRPIEIPALENIAALDTSKDELLRGLPDNRSLLYCSVTENGRLLSENILYFARPKEQALPFPEIERELENTAEGFRLRLQTPVLARHVIIDAGDLPVRLSDNFFDLPPNRPVEILLTAEKKITESELRRSLRIYHLQGMIS